MAQRPNARTFSALVPLMGLGVAACESTPSEPDPGDVEIDVTVSGAVVDQETTEPVEGAQVAVYAAAGGDPLAEATTGVAGSYSMGFSLIEEDTPAGLRIEAERFGFHEYETTVPFSPVVSHDIALEAGPREIATIEDLQKIGHDPDYPLDADYVLVADIDASETTDWDDGRGFDPIGRWGGAVDPDHEPFTGTFDGDGHAIAGLSIDRPDQEGVGLFALVTGRVVDVAVVDAEISGWAFTGPLVGVNAGGEVLTSHADGVVSGDPAGGLVGMNVEGEIRDAYATGVVTSEGAAGGLVGRNERAGVFDSYAAADVSGNTAGGLAGVERDGGFVGTYWDVDASGQVAAVGSGSPGESEGLTTGEMIGEAAEANMPALDFQDTWQVVPDGYPALHWQSL